MAWIFGVPAAALVCAVGISQFAGHIPTSPTSTASSAPSVDAASAAPDGYTETEAPGVFYRWCLPEHNCPEPSYTIGRYMQMEVYCRDRSCDLYAEVRVKNSAGQVIGWTNDTGNGAAGDHVFLTLDTTEEFAESFDLSKLNVH